MNYKNKPELQERLAAEYALGTLRGAARARFKRWMREDAAIARAVAEWEGRLAPMAASVAERRPPARLWREIEARLSPAAPSRRGFLWKGLGLAAGGAAAAVVVMAVFPALQRPTAGYIALLSDPRTQKPVLIVSARRNDTDLQIRTLDPAIQVADASLELWALPKGGKPRSLGLISDSERPGFNRAALRMTANADRTLSDVPTLAVSLEPRGGSPVGAPTGPVLYSGPCVKDW
ncbi:MAG TPA: anti-sigma factor [Burkholderiales bacterium]|nr:anti-sigma factor [Burkholderiales bacterium]